MFIGEIISDSRTISRVTKFESREMVCHNVFDSFLVLDCDVKFLQQEDPPNQSRLGILFGKEILKGCMICEDGDG